MAISTLGEFAQGRVILNVSVGNILNLGESGIEPLKPIRIMREYVEALRALWAGAPVTHEGELHKLRGAKMVFDQGRQYPIYVASTGPQMLKLAGEIADGVLLSAGLRLASTRRCLVLAHAGVAAKGRDPAALRRCSFINCNVSEDRMAARAAMLRKLSFLFRSRGHADNIKSSNLDIDHQAIMASHARHDFDGAVRLLPVEAANIFAVAGTPAQCRTRLEEYLAMGLDEPVIEVSGTAQERKLALDVVRELRGDRRPWQTVADSRGEPGLWPAPPYACYRAARSRHRRGPVRGRRGAVRLRQVIADEARDRAAAADLGHHRGRRQGGRRTFENRRHGLSESYAAALAHHALERDVAAGDRRAASPSAPPRARTLPAAGNALLGMVGLQDFGEKYPWQLSGGMQQRASLCRSLIHEPALLMLDEPFGALDAFTREELWDVLRDLWMQRRFTTILVTHDLREAVYLADTVHVMSSRPGRIIGTHDVPLERPRRPRTTYEPRFVEIVARIREEIRGERNDRPGSHAVREERP